MKRNKPQRIFIDTEFTDFINTDLISLGAVLEDGSKEFYVELTDYNKKASSEFVRKIVEPQLDLEKYGVTRMKAAALFGSWLDELEGEYVICADYVGDWEIIIDLIKYLPPNIQNAPSMLVSDLGLIILDVANELQTPNFPWFFGEAKKQYHEGFLEYFLRNPSPKQHHALADAKANRYGWLKAMEWLNNQRLGY